MSNLVNWVLKGRSNDDKSGNDDSMEDVSAMDTTMTDVSESLSPEEIRRKRLAKFSSSSRSDGERQGNTSPPSESKSPSNAKTSTPQKIAVEELTPSKVSISQSSSNSTPTGTKESDSTPSRASLLSTASPKAQSTLSPEDRYIHETISRLCKVTLITRGTSAVFLEKLASTGKIHFQLEDVDEILMERPLYCDTPFFDFLLEVYNKTHHEIAEVSDKIHKLPAEFRKQVLQFLEKSVLSYATMFLYQPETFPENSISTEYMGPDRGAAILLRQLLLPVDHPGDRKSVV